MAKIVVLGGDGFCGWPTSLHLSRRGHDVTQATVSRDLEDLGLKVEDRTVDNPGDQEEDTVADVSPSGKVDAGETVTLSVYDKPAEVEVPETPLSTDATPKNKGKGKKKP